jgi:hypothetical protein
MLFFIYQRFAGFVAAMCGLLLIPWILGVPGHPSRAVESAWTIGLLVIILYLAAFQLVRSMDKKAATNRFRSLSRWERLLFKFAWLSFILLSLCVLVVILSPFD